MYLTSYISLGNQLLRVGIYTFADLLDSCGNRCALGCIFLRERVSRGLCNLSVAGFVLLLGACAGLPTKNLQSVAAKDGHQETVVESTRFFHRVFSNQKKSANGVLNVYLEGDGLPWIFRYFVVSDPTPRWPLMLHLMERDENAAVYIGRPCYNGFASSKGCSSVLWTAGRYSTDVVSSMVEVLRAEMLKHQATKINLFGHSGGGAIAMLMAEQLSETRSVVTMAGNLDTDAWTSLHGYSPLFTSLNPSKRAPLDRRVTQVHLMGGRDRNIPPNLARQWVTSQPNSYGVIFQDFDHSCCWNSQWRSIVRQVTRGAQPLEFAVKPFKIPPRQYLSHQLSGESVQQNLRTVSEYTGHTHIQ